MSQSRWQEASCSTQTTIKCRSRSFRWEFVFSIVITWIPLLRSGAMHLDNSHLFPLRQVLTSKFPCCLTYLILEMRKNFRNQLKLSVYFVSTCLTPRMVHSGINPNTFSCALHLVDNQAAMEFKSLTQDKSSSDPEFLPAVTLLSIINHSSPREWAESFGLRFPAVLQLINVSAGSETFSVCSFDQTK